MTDGEFWAAHHARFVMPLLHTGCAISHLAVTTARAKNCVTSKVACRNDVPQEYSGEDETISAVGLVRPKPGVFVPAIQYLLVVCTTIEVQHYQPVHSPVEGASLS